MTLFQEFNSWKSPPALQISPVPEIDSKAPSSSKLPVPDKDGKPIIISFLRHCGCPGTSAFRASLTLLQMNIYNFNFHKQISGYSVIHYPALE